MGWREQHAEGALWLRSATVPIRDNIDAIVGDLQRAAR
jgi:hypothetical protein